MVALAGRGLPQPQPGDSLGARRVLRDARVDLLVHYRALAVSGRHRPWRSRRQAVVRATQRSLSGFGPDAGCGCLHRPGTGASAAEPAWLCSLDSGAWPADIRLCGIEERNVSHCTPSWITAARPACRAVGVEGVLREHHRLDARPDRHRLSDAGCVPARGLPAAVGPGHDHRRAAVRPPRSPRRWCGRPVLRWRSWRCCRSRSAAME